MIELKDIQKFWISFALMVIAIVMMTNNAIILMDYPEFMLGWMITLVVGILLFMYIKWTIRFYRRMKFGVKVDWD